MNNKKTIQVNKDFLSISNRLSKKKEAKAKKTKDYVVDKITPNAYKVDGEFSETIDLREIPIVAAGEDQAIFKLALDNPDAEFGKYRIKGRQLTTLLQYMANNDLLKDGQQFNENFEKALIFKALKFDANDNLKWSGDTSYLSLFELSDEDQALFDKLTGEGGENIPKKFNNLQYLIKVLVNEELNTKL